MPCTESMWLRIFEEDPARRQVSILYYHEILPGSWTDYRCVILWQTDWHLVCWVRPRRTSLWRSLLQGPVRPDAASRDNQETRHANLGRHGGYEPRSLYEKEVTEGTSDPHGVALAQRDGRIGSRSPQKTVRLQARWETDCCAGPLSSVLWRVAGGKPSISDWQLPSRYFLVHTLWTGPYRTGCYGVDYSWVVFGAESFEGERNDEEEMIIN